MKVTWQPIILKVKKYTASDNLFLTSQHTLLLRLSISVPWRTQTYWITFLMRLRKAYSWASHSQLLRQEKANLWIQMGGN